MWKAIKVSALTFAGFAMVSATPLPVLADGYRDGHRGRQVTRKVIVTRHDRDDDRWHRRHPGRGWGARAKHRRARTVVIHKYPPVQKVIVHRPAVKHVVVHPRPVYANTYPHSVQNGSLLGGLIGATLGAVAGNQIGKGSGRTAAIIGGAIVGAVVGSNIGQSMQQADHYQVNQVLETAPSGRRVTWRNPDTGSTYAVLPTRTYQSGNGGYCREFTTWGWIDGYEEQLTGTACRQTDGTWRRII